MAKRIIWTPNARDEKKRILSYWLKRNKSNVYFKKLNILFKQAIHLIANKPIPRRITDFEDVYVKIVRDYKIFFTEDEESRYIISIWDTRQAPNKLEDVIKK